MNMDNSIDSTNFFLFGVIFSKDLCCTYMPDLAVFVKKGPPFARDLRLAKDKYLQSEIFKALFSYQMNL